MVLLMLQDFNYQTPVKSLIDILFALGANRQVVVFR